MPVANYGTPVALEPDQYLDLPRGEYANLSVKSRATVVLSTGTYVFDQAFVDRDAKLLIDSSDGPVQVYVKGGWTYRGSVASTSSEEPQLFVGVLGADTSYVEAPFVGVLVAPNAPVRLQSAQPPDHRGAFHAKELYLEPGTQIERFDLDWIAIVDDGVVVEPYPEGPPHLMPESPGEVYVSDPSWAGGDPPGGSVTKDLSEELTFELRDEFEVEGGVIGNGTVTFDFETPNGTTHTCTYKGQSTSSEITTKLDFALGRLLKFESCSDGQPADFERKATSYTVSFEGIPNFPVTVGSPITKDGHCSEKIPLITASETAQMRESFDWSTATKLPETDSDGNPALYYAWVYIRDEEELSAYRQLLIHELSTPLFDEELDALAGKCGVLTNPGDGEGAFVPSVIPGVTYNRLIDALTSDQVEGDRIIFDAVVMRDIPDGAQTPNGSLSYQLLAESGFAYLHYQNTAPLSTDAAIELDGSGASKALVSALQWIGEVVVATGETILERLGELDEFFRGDIDIKIVVSELNSDTAFFSIGGDPMIRAWGPLRDNILGADKVQLTVLQRFFGTSLPSTSRGRTNLVGRAGLNVVRGETRGNGLCIKLKSDGAMVTEFLLAQELCDFRAMDSSEIGSVSNFELNNITSARTSIPVVADHGRLAGLYQSDDLHQWAQNVIGIRTKRARVLSGYWADTFAPVKENGWEKNLFAPCLNYSNSLSEAMLLGATTGGLLANLTAGLVGIPGTEVVTIAASMFAAVIGNTDIVMADNSDIQDSRSVMSHEYGHYLFCSLLQSQDPASVSRVIWSTIASASDDLAAPIRYLNEAMADYFTGQVTGGADYSWLRDLPPDGADFPGPYCFDNGAPCFDANLSSSATGDGSIGRVATLIHDLFDGRLDGFTANVPGNADLHDGPDAGALSLASAQYGSKDAHLERVQLRGNHFFILADKLAQELDLVPLPLVNATNLNDYGIYGALNRTMSEVGVTWCDRCRALALHVPGSKTDVQELWSTCTSDTLLSSVLGPPPVDDLRMSAFDDDPLGVATCQECPEGMVSDGEGRCTPCENTVSGNSCEVCSADVIIDATTVELGAHSFATTHSVAGDTCPEVFWVEVIGLPGFYARDTADEELIGSRLELSPQTEDTCSNVFSLITNWNGGAGPGDVLSGTGTWAPCDATLCPFDECQNLPDLWIEEGDLQGTSVRFGAPSNPLTEMRLDFVLQDETIIR